MLELILGEAASGKSEFAETEALRLGEPRYYLATMIRGNAAGDERIEKHVKRREGKGFITIERPTEIGAAADVIKGGTVLLECMTNLAANELFKGDMPLNMRRETEVYEGLCISMGRIADNAENLVIVSGDIFRDGKAYGVETETYAGLLARLNRHIAKMADIVYEVVYSCPKRIK